MRKRNLRALALMAALLGAVQAPATATAHDGAHGGGGGKPKLVTSVEGITEYQLDNGMRVLLFPDGSKDTVTVNLTVFVGSRQEGYGETGMAHLLEHLLFKGTTKYKDPWKLLQEHGATFNGSTWTDRTNYFETMPATDENLKWGIEFEADRMMNSRVDAEDLKSEFSVVRNEFEIGENNPAGVLEERMSSTAYLWHNYGKSTIGSRSDIERVPIENLKAFYRKYYQPDNAMLVVSGKFKTERVLELVQGSFGQIAKPTRKLGSSYTQEPVQDGERQVTLRRNGDVAVIGLMYHTVAGGDEDFLGTEALVHLLTAEPSGRLYQALVKTGLATRVYGATYAWAEPGTLQIYAEVSADKKLEPVRDKMIAIVEGLATGKSKITEDEVKRFRVQTLKDWKLTFTSSQSIAVQLSEWAAIGDWRMIFIYRDRAEKLEAARVQNVAAAYLKAANRTLGMFVPTKTPERSPVPAAVIDVAKLVNGYKGRDKVVEGEQFDATVANVEKRTTRGALKNGMKTALLAKKTRGEAVRLMLTLHYGTEKDLEGKTTAADLMGDMLMRGTKKHTYQELKDEFDVLDSSVYFGGGAGALTATITTTKKNLPAVLDLVTEVLQQPTFPKDQFEILRKENLSSLEEQLSDPQAQLFVALVQTLRPYKKDDVRYVPTTVENIARYKAVKLADVQALYKGWVGGSFAELTVVGDFDAATLVPQLEQNFGAWKSAKPFKRIESPYVDVPAGEQVIDTPDKENSLIAVGHNVEMRDDDADFPALEIANFMLGGSASSRIFNRLRQKEGISYGAGSQFQADSEDKSGLFLAFAAGAPQNVPRAMKAMLEEINLFVDKGVTADELAKAKASWKKDFDRSLSNDGGVMGTINRYLHLGRTLEFDQKLADAVGKLTLDDVNKAIKKHIRPAALVKVTAGDQKKQNAPAPAKDAGVGAK